MKAWVQHILRGRFSMLLFSLALMFFVLPILPGDKVLLEKEISIFGLVVVVSCLRAISVNRAFFMFVLGLSLVNVAIGSAALLRYDGEWFRIVALLFRLVYYIIIFFSIMRYVFDSTPVTVDKVCGAIAAYILMGIAWSVVYALFCHLEPASFDLPSGVDTDSLVGSWALYFSFTTLTTLGYGDITPQLTAARTYAYAEAACGQIFLAVIIARLVALQIVHSSNPAGARKEFSDLD